MNQKNKEQIHDEMIGPLMEQIIAICREHGISMLATFAIPTDDDPDLVCTSALHDGTGKYPKFIAQALNVIRGGGPPLTQTVTRDANVN